MLPPFLLRKLLYIGNIIIISQIIDGLTGKVISHGLKPQKRAMGHDRSLLADYTLMQ